jgi:cation transport ATPase
VRRARRVEKALSRTEGVVAANGNLAAEKAAVEFDPLLVSEGELAGVVEEVGYGVAREEEGAPEGDYRVLRADFLLAAMTLSSVTVVSNALRLRGVKVD